MNTAVDNIERSGPDGAPDDGWLRPIGHDRSTPAAWTRLGTLDGPGEPIVDPRGMVQVAPGMPGIAWWIAGDDRWYFPSKEKTVRQSLVHNMPIVETRMRVKGGDVCMRACAVTVPGARGLRELVVLEVENTTGVPCGVAFAVRPFGILDDVPVHRIRIDGATLVADDRPVLILPREPAGSLAGVGADGDIVAQVRQGAATGSSFDPVDCPDGRAQAVVVVPLAHRNVFRVVVPVPDPDGSFDPDSARFAAVAPPAENVAKGWRAQLRDRARVSVPDPRLQAVFAAAPSWLSATTNHPAAAVARSAWDPVETPRWQHVASAAQALDRLGLHERSEELLARGAAAYLDSPLGDATWLVEAFADHVVRSGDDRFAAAVAETCEVALASGRSRTANPVAPWRRHGVFAAATAVFRAAGERSAARASEKAARSATAEAPTRVSAMPAGLDRCTELVWARRALGSGDARGAWELLDRYLDTVTSTGVWAEQPEGGADRHSVGVSAAVVCLAADLLVSVHGDTLRLVAFAPPPWVGRPLEVAGFPTEGGTVGYAVRWHGDRPALLWEVVRGSSVRDLPDGVVVSAPGLDADWRGAGRSGEALLGEVAPSDAPARSGSRMTGLQIGPSRGGS